MKRLLKSSKFWLAVIGAVTAVLVWMLTNSEGFAMYVSGFFGVGILGNSAEDMMTKYSNKRPPLVDKVDEVNVS